MALYNVEVIETLSRVVEQEAESYEDAVELVSTKYLEEEIILDWEDLESTKYEPYPSQEFAEDFDININYDVKNKVLNFSNRYESIATYNCKSFEELNNSLKDFFKDYVELKEVKSEEREIKFVTEDIIDEYINCWAEHKSVPIEADLLYCKTDNKYIALDNTSGDCWVEEFDDEKNAKRWLSHEIEYEDYLQEKNKQQNDLEL